MQFSVIQTRVANETGLSTTDDATTIKAWINAAYKHVLGLFNWPWLLKNATVQTVADITTGTVTINAGSTSLTFSSGPAVSVANQYMIKFSVTDDWYLISSHTAASTSATLSVPLVGSTNISAGSYTLRKVLYSLPSDLDRVVDIRQAITKQKLGAVDIRTFDGYLPDPSSTGDPLYYAMCGMDTNKYWQVTLYPIPTAIENLQVRYLQTPADMSGDTDTPLLPEKFHDILVFGALYLYGHPYIDDSRVSDARERFNAMLEDMKVSSNPIPDQLTILQPWDQRPRRVLGRLPWPSTYPDYWR